MLRTLCNARIMLIWDRCRGRDLEALPAIDIFVPKADVRAKGRGITETELQLCNNETVHNISNDMFISGLDLTIAAENMWGVGFYF